MRARLATILIVLHVASVSLAAHGAVAMDAAGGATGPQQTMAHGSAPSGAEHTSHVAQPPGQCDHVSQAMVDECDDCEVDAGCTCCYLCCTLVVGEPESGAFTVPHQQVLTLRAAVAPAGVMTPIYRPPRS